MKLKKATLLFVLLVLFSCFSLTVNALEESSLDDTVLNEELVNVDFVSGNVIVLGNLSDNLTVENFLSNKINPSSSFLENYDIASIYVLDNEEPRQTTEIVSSGMKLVFETNNETTYEYEIKVVGDMNNDGIVNDIDVDVMIDDILNDKDVNVINDINGDGICDVLDVTETVYSIDNSDWDVGTVDDDIKLTSELTALDLVYVGDLLEVTYKIRGYNSSRFKGISGILNYDKNLLELDSVFVESDYGHMNDDGKFLYVISKDTDEVIFTIRFNVISKGSTTISIDSSLSSVDGICVASDELDANHSVVINEYGIGGDEEVSNDSSNSTTTSTVANTVSNTPLVSFNNESYYVSNVVATQVSLSSDNYIKSLKIKNYNINFDKDVLEYSIVVGNNVNSLELEIILNDEKATYDVLGNSNFKVGKNKVTIEVTAEDGGKRLYVINVDKKAKKVSDNDKKDNNSRVAIIILLILIIMGLIYVIFKDDEDEKNKD